MKPKTRFWPQDADGYLLNDSSSDKVLPKYLPLIEEIRALCSRYLPETDGSFYIFGSVVRGTASDESDLDCMLVTHGLSEFGWVDIERRKLLQKFPVVTNVQIDTETVDTVMNTQQFSWPTFLLATQGVCIYGHDLIPTLPQFKPSVYIANSELVQAREIFAEAKAEIGKATSDDQIRYWCKRIMKNLIRAGLPVYFRQSFQNHRKNTLESRLDNK